MPVGIFQLELFADPSDVDELAHISNVTYVRWLQEAARAHSTAAGWDFATYQRFGAAWVVHKQEIEYLVPCHAGDPITLATWIESFGVATAHRRTEIRRGGELLARANTTWVLVSLETRRPCRIPAELRSAFE